MGFLKWLQERISGVTSVPQDIRSEGPRAALAKRADKVWHDSTDVVKTAGQDVRMGR